MFIQDKEAVFKAELNETVSYTISGGVSLKGSISIPGSKNAALPAIVGACLASEAVTLTNVPMELNDVRLLLELLESVGVKVTKISNTKLELDGSDITNGILDGTKASKIRHSLLLLGLSASKGKSLFLPIPGGCNIGNRKHDLHVLALKKVGHDLEETDFGINLKTTLNKDSLQENKIDFHYPTFGGTFNAIFASVLLTKKITIIKNPAKNPEVLDVIEMLNNMGADVKWDADGNIIVKGVNKLRGTTFQVMSDRIIAATMIIAIGATKGEGTIIGANSKYLKMEIDAWRNAGLKIETVDNGIYVRGGESIKAIDITTGAYPAFHTDIQPLHGVLMVLSEKTSIIKDTILDGRFKYAEQLNKLGAFTEVKKGDYICVNGAQGQDAFFYKSNPLKGSLDLYAPDIRGGAAVVIGALLAQGKSCISNVYQIERGYTQLPEMLNKLGANIVRNY